MNGHGLTNGAAARSRGIFTTFIDRDAYVAGLLVLASSLREVGSAHEFRPMVTPGVSSQARDAMTAFGLSLIDIDPITLSKEQQACLSRLANDR